MFRKITVALSFLAITAPAFAQVEWRQLPPNPNLSGPVFGYDVAIEGGTCYVAYNIMNSSSGYFDVFFDSYTPSAGWQNLLTYPTTNNTVIDLKMIRCGSNQYAMVNTNNTTQLTLFQIGGGSAYELLTQNFPSFASTCKWNLHPGSQLDEIYLTYDYSTAHFFYAYTYGAPSWISHGDPFSASGVSPTDVAVYVNQDSVFVAGKYTTTPSDKIKVRAASKTNWLWNNYSLPNGDVYAMNGPVADTVTGTSPFLFFGDLNNSTISMIASDNGNEKEIPLGLNAYGQGVPFPLDYDVQPDIATSQSRPYFMTHASNLTDANVVYSRDPATGIWGLVGNGPFVSNAISPSYKRIQTTYNTERVIIGFADVIANPDAYTLMLTNALPVITDTGEDFPQLCGNTNSSSLSALIIEDVDGDEITFVSAASSNGALIDPADVDVSIFPNGSYFEIYASVNTGVVSAPEEVTITYNFSDGYDIIQHVVTYEIVPSPDVYWLDIDDTLTFCNNGDIVDLYDYVSVPGGTFSGNESDYPGHYWDPSLVTDPSIFEMGLHYMYSNGACMESDYTTIMSWEAPSADMSTTPSSNCTANDGTAELDISGGTAPYAFTWNNGNDQDITLSDLAPGNLHVDIVDANGCTVVADGIVSNAGATITGNITPISCFGAADGAIDLTVSGMVTPLVTMWSNGHASEDVAELQPGTHTVWITDASGCTATANFDVYEPEQLQLDLTGYGTNCGLSEGYVEINYAIGGTFPYTYLWSDNTTGTTITDLPTGIYSLTITDANGCEVTAYENVTDYGAPYIYGAEVINSSCGLSDGAINTEVIPYGNNTVIEWSTNAGTDSISGLAPGTYTLHLSNDENCHNYYHFNITTKAPDRQPLCLVTVDSLTSTNLLVWEKIGDIAIDYFNIYRETVVSGEFQKIDSVQNTNMSIFNDVVASPIERSWKYRITAVNECGVESVPSIAHKTIHLTTLDLGGGDFKVVWNFYEGTTYSGFNVYRYTNSTGWTLIGSTPSGLTYFLDTDTPTDITGLDYMVEIAFSNTCTADLEKAQDFNSSRSNKDKGQFSVGNGTGDSNNSLIELGAGTVSLYPNPVSGEKIFVELESIPAAAFTIVSLTGQQVAAGELSEGTTSVDMTGLQSGVYIMHIHTNNDQISLRFIVN